MISSTLSFGRLVCGSARFFVTAIAAVSLLALPAQSQTVNGHRTVKALTYNMDEGTDFIEVLSAQSLSEFLDAVQLTWNNVQASNPSFRAELLARRIVADQPDVVALEEVTTWATGTWSWSQMTCVPDTVRINALQLLMDALARHGAHYQVLGQLQEFQLGGPFPDMTTCVAAADSDVILGRVAGASAKLNFSNVQMEHYLYYASLPSLIGLIPVPRGWLSVDVSVAGQTFRFVGTHLEDGTANPQLAVVAAAEVGELLSGPANTTLPVIIAGDFNSNANDPEGSSYPAYAAIVGAGFSDAWFSVHPDIPGCTWGPDGILPNPDYVRTQRIDFVFARDVSTLLTSALLGAAPHDRINGYWPSDHAGVAALVQFP